MILNTRRQAASQPARQTVGQTLISSPTVKVDKWQAARDMDRQRSQPSFEWQSDWLMDFAPGKLYSIIYLNDLQMHFYTLRIAVVVS